MKADDFLNDTVSADEFLAGETKAQRNARVNAAGAVFEEQGGNSPLVRLGKGFKAVDVLGRFLGNKVGLVSDDSLRTAAEDFNVGADPRIERVTNTINDASGFGGTAAALWKALSNDPGAVAGLALEQVPTMALSLPVGGVAGSVVGNVAGRLGANAAVRSGLTGAGVVSSNTAAQSFPSSFAEGLQQPGATIESAQAFGAKKAGAEAAVAALFGPLAAKTVGGRLGNTMFQGARGGVSEMAETLGGNTAVGQDTTKGDLLLSGVLGSVMDLPEAAVARQVAGTAITPQARALADAIGGFDGQMPAAAPIDQAVRQSGVRFDPVAAAAANRPPVVPQLPFDPSVQNPSMPIVVDPAGTARPMGADEFLDADTTRQEQRDTGLTPDVQQAIAARNVAPAPETAPDVPSDLVQRLIDSGWVPPDKRPKTSDGKNPNPDQATVDGIGQDLEQLYQQDVKDGIKQRLGLEQPPAKQSAPEVKPSSYAQSPFLREIAARGGVNIGERNDAGIDPKRSTASGRVMPSPYNIGGKPLFRPDGLRGDALVESLVSQGYLTQAQVDEADAGGVGGSDQLAYDLIRSELDRPGSVKPINMQGDAAQQAMQRRASSELDAKARSIGLDTKGLSDEQINLALKRIERRLNRAHGRSDVSREVKAEREAVNDVSSNSAFDDSDIPWDNVDSNASTEDAMRALGFSEQEIADATADRPQGQGQSGEAVRETPPNEPAGTQGPDPADARSEGGQRNIAAETPASYAAEPADFDLTSTPYEKDLFGDSAAQQPARNDRPAEPASVGVRRDVQPVSGVQDTPAPPGDYYVNTIVGTEVQRELGASRITSPEEAAQATQYLYRSAVERMDGIVTDKSGKPLAVIGGFKGALAQTSVYPGTLAAEAVRIPGAAYVWFSHNHPSGTAVLSRADESLNRALSETFRGSGIEPMGLLAIAGDKFSYVNAAADQYSQPTPQYGEIPTPTTKMTVPTIERQLGAGNAGGTALAHPQAAKDHARAYYTRARAPGIMLLDSQNRVVAWIPISDDMKGPLRHTGQLNIVWRAVSQANAGAAIIVHGGELDSSQRLPGSLTPSENIAAALQKIDVRPLDSINVKTGISVAETTGAVAIGPVYSKAAKSPDVASLVDLRKRESILKSLRKCLA